MSPPERNPFMKAKKILAVALALVCALAVFASCGKTDDGRKQSRKIQVITREEGSGTRSAFTELLGIVDADKKDAITQNAESTSSTAVMITTVEGSKNAIGFISLGSLGSTVKALSVDGVAPAVENIKDGSYKVQRPFNICYQEGKLTDLAKDFISYIESAEGQGIIAKGGYIAVNESAPAYTKKDGLSGKVTLAGSTSVSPIMMKIADAYKKINPNVSVEIQESGSGAGITSATEGACDIGMSSRALKDSELKVLKSQTIAQDGIAVIVNKNNSVSNLTAAQIKDIFLGNLTDWSDLSK